MPDPVRVGEKMSALTVDRIPAQINKIGPASCELPGHGHELTPENLYTQPSRPNDRLCRMCRKREVRSRGK